MQNNILISVIIPVYNTQPYLNRCLDSLVNQTYCNLELIIINDGSTDGSIKILNEYVQKDSRINLINKENEGIGAAYIDALRIAKGDYISFVDSDDYISLSMYSILSKYAIDYDIIQFGWQYFNEKDEIVKIVSFKPITVFGNKNIVRYQFEKLRRPNLLKLIKRELFSDISILKQNVGIDNLITYQIISKAKSLIVIKDILYNGFVRENSISRASYDCNKISEQLKLSFRKIELFQYTHNKYLYKYVIKEHTSLVLLIGNMYYKKGNKNILNEFIYKTCNFDKFYKLLLGSYGFFSIKYLLKITLFRINHNLYFKLFNNKCSFKQLLKQT